MRTIAFWWIAVVLFSASLVAKTYRFGAITTVDPKIVQKRFEPLLRYLDQVTGEHFVFATGRNYDDTIEKFVNGDFDLGYIGPSPYVTASRKAPGALRIIAGVESHFTPYFEAMIVAAKNAPLHRLEDLAGKTFAFGSRRSTLSFYLPYYMLMQAGVLDKLKRFVFLGRHDAVAKSVIMGMVDAGGIKRSVEETYRRHLKVLAISEPVVDFAIVVHKSMDPKLARKIRQALLTLKDPKILTSIKKDMTGFGPRKDSDYDRLRKIMRIVDKDLARYGEP